MSQGPLATLKEQIEAEANILEKNIEEYRDNMLAKIEEAKTNEILAAISRLAKRMEEIENRLPPVEEDS